MRYINKYALYTIPGTTTARPRDRAGCRCGRCGCHIFICVKLTAALRILWLRGFIRKPLSVSQRSKFVKWWPRRAVNSTIYCDCHWRVQGFIILRCYLIRKQIINSNHTYKANSLKRTLIDGLFLLSGIKTCLLASWVIGRPDSAV